MLGCREMGKDVHMAKGEGDMRIVKSLYWIVQRVGCMCYTIATTSE